MQIQPVECLQWCLNVYVSTADDLILNNQSGDSSLVNFVSISQQLLIVCNSSSRGDSPHLCWGVILELFRTCLGSHDVEISWM